MSDVRNNFADGIQEKIDEIEQAIADGVADAESNEDMLIRLRQLVENAKDGTITDDEMIMAMLRHMKLWLKEYREGKQ